jgi:hypothetical protein
MPERISFLNSMGWHSSCSPLADQSNRSGKPISFSFVIHGLRPAQTVSHHCAAASFLSLRDGLRQQGMIF